MERGTSQLTTEFQTVEVAWRVDGLDDPLPDFDPTAPVVLCLHGWGMNEDWFSLLLQGLFDLPYRFLIPRATIPVEREDGRVGGSWYDYDGDQGRFQAELSRTDALFLALLQDVEARLGWTPRTRGFLGFSQGGYCGSVCVLRNPTLFHALVVSGARIKTEILEPEIARAGDAGMGALLLHGTRDESVRMVAAESSHQALAGGGVDTELHTFDAGHSLGRAQIAVARGWLARRLDSH